MIKIYGSVVCLSRAFIIPGCQCYIFFAPIMTYEIHPQLLELMLRGLREYRLATFFVRLSKRLSHTECNGPKPLKTPFYDFHVSEGAKLVDFCGYSLPIVYRSQSIIDSHRHVRANCGIFDVSHMLQVYTRSV